MNPPLEVLAAGLIYCMYKSIQVLLTGTNASSLNQSKEITKPSGGEGVTVT